MEPQEQMGIPLLRYTKKALFLAFPIAAVTGAVIAERSQLSIAYGLFVGGIGPLTLALALDHYLDRDTEIRSGRRPQ